MKIRYFFLFCLIALFIVCCNKNDEADPPDYAEKISGKYHGNININLENNFVNDIDVSLLYVDKQNVTFKFEKKMPVPSLGKDVSFNIDCNCVVTFSKDTFEINGNTVTKCFYDNTNVDALVFVGGYIAKSGNALFNISTIQEPVLVTYIFEGKKVDVLP